MPIHNSIAALKEEMTAWRRDIHAHPETAFEEVRTAGLVAERLRGWGIDVATGLAGTGVVGTLRGRGGGTGSIGLRADMDALNMTEANALPYRSQNPGKFHGCGHDGHTTMLLGAARYLAETRNFDGTVRFIFQPAEEGAGGGRRMVEEGLFDLFPCDEVYALHNWPDLPVGEVAVHRGAMMAASDEIKLTIRGHGGHAAMPQKCTDPVVVAAQFIMAAQTVVSRSLDPLDSAVVSITQVQAGSAFNVIPDEVWLGGTARSFRPEVSEQIEAGLRALAHGLGAAFGVEITLGYRRGYPPTVNHAAQADVAAAVARSVVGEGRVHVDLPPVMGAEDFAYMLQSRPGAYIWIGQGGGPGACSVHNPRYDFNDEILPIGASVLAALVETQLKRTGDGT